MAKAAYLPLEIKRGETFEKEFTMFQSDGVTPLPITGWILTCDVKADANSYDALFSPVISLVDNGDNGVWKLSISSSVSSAISSTAKTLLEIDRYWYDVRADSGSEVEYLFEGDFNVKGAVTIP